MSEHARSLAKKIRSREARIGVIGLGYVGLPLSVEFATAGFRVTGIDVDRAKVQGIRAGRSHVEDVSSESVREGQLRARRAPWPGSGTGDGHGHLWAGPVHRP